MKKIRLWRMGLALLLSILLLFPTLYIHAEMPDTGGQDDAASQPPGQEVDLEPAESPPDDSAQNAQNEDTLASETGPAATPEREALDKEWELIEEAVLPAAAEGFAYVSTSSQLVAAIQDANDYEAIYLSNNLTLSAGATINAAKTQLVIDGQGYTLTQSTTQSTTIKLPGSYACTQIVFRNMTVDSSTHYGMAWLDTGQSGVTMTFDNVQYTGPQPATNPAGPVILKDSGFTLVNKGILGSSPAQELAEANAVTLEGTVTATSSNSYDLFKFERSGSITVAAGAQVNLSTSSSALFGAGSGIYPPITLGEGASFTLATGNGVGGSSATGAIHLAPGANWQINYAASTTTTGINIRSGHALNISAGARLGLTANVGSTLYSGGTGISSGGSITVAGTLAVSLTSRSAALTPATAIAANGTFAVQPGARLEVWQYYSSIAIGPTAGSAISLASGTAFTADNPSRVIVYADGQAFQTSGSSSIRLTADAINQWTSKPGFSGGQAASLPTTVWSSANTAPIGVSVASTTVTGSSGVILSPANAAISTFRPAGSYLVTLGSLQMTVDACHTLTEAFTGTAPAGANMSGSFYTGQSGNTRSLSGTAAGGSYSLAIAAGDYPKEETYVGVYATLDNLTAYRRTVVQPGILELVSAPEFLIFGELAVPGTPTYFAPEYCAVFVSDTRSVKADWQLRLSVSVPLTSGSGHTLPGALVFLPQQGAALTLSPSAAAAYRGEGPFDGGQVDTLITFDEQFGPQLYVDPAMSPVAGQTYTTTLHWSLVDGV